MPIPRAHLTSLTTCNVRPYCDIFVSFISASLIAAVNESWMNTNLVGTSASKFTSVGASSGCKFASRRIAVLAANLYARCSHSRCFVSNSVLTLGLVRAVIILSGLVFTLKANGAAVMMLRWTPHERCMWLICLSAASCESW